VRKVDTQPSGLCCSFCRKPQNLVSKLISSPSDYPRAYICDECIAVCASILEDDGRPIPAVSATPESVGEKHPLLAHRLAPSLLSAIEHWIRHESLGVDAANELGEIRKIAVEMMMEHYSGKSDL
jgi:ClpX C4-type zinc finger protein